MAKAFGYPLIRPANLGGGYLVVGRKARPVIESLIFEPAAGGGGVISATLTSPGLAAVAWQSRAIAQAALSASGIAATSFSSGAIVGVTFASAGVATTDFLAPALNYADALLTVSGLALTAFQSDYGGRMRVRLGGVWQKKPMKQWTGTAWVEVPVKVWSGSAWKVI